MATGTCTDPDTGSLGYLVWVNKSVQLQGGWNLSFAVRDADAYPTELDAQGLGRVVYIHNATTVIDNVASGNGGGLFLAFRDTLSLTNNVLADNSAAAHGDQLYIYAGEWPSLVASLRHNTFAHRAGGDEAIYVGDYATVWMTNTLVVSHTTGILEDGTDSSVQADYTLFAANGSNYQGDVSSSHEVTGTPGFVDPAGRDYHLTSTSDAIDASIDAGVYTYIDGGYRPGGPGFDIGADEWWLRVILPIVFRQYLP